MKYSDKQRVQKIYEYAEKLINHITVNGISKDSLVEDYALQWLVTTPLYNIGEQVYALSDEYKLEYSEIPWSMISGLRHRLVHNYDGTNWNIIADVVFEELPILIQQLEKLI